MKEENRELKEKISKIFLRGENKEKMVSELLDLQKNFNLVDVLVTFIKYVCSKEDIFYNCWYLAFYRITIIDIQKWLLLF